MTASPRMLEICSMCRRVRDDRETTYDRWVTKKTYRQSTGIAPADCRLTYTYCPGCSGFLHNYLKAA
jgi:hypothetical protein